MRRVRTLSLFTAILITLLMPVHILLAGITTTVTETYQRCAITAYFPDKDNQYYLEVSGPGGTFNMSNSGSCYIEGSGKATINYGYLAKGSKLTIKITDASGSELEVGTFFLSENTKGSFLVSPPSGAATPTPIPSPTPEPTRPPEATPTPIPPVVINTPTPVPATNTPIPTTAPVEDTPTPIPTETPTPEPTATETPTPIPTDTPVPTEEPTPVPTETPTPEPTDTPVPEVTDIPEPTIPPTNDSGFVHEVKKVAAIIPGVYIEDGTQHLRIKPQVILAGTLIMYIIGLVSTFLIINHQDKKKRLIEMYFRGGMDIESKEEENT